MTPVVVWFRRDLRLHDNGALAAAAVSERPVVPLFVLDEESRGVRSLGGASRWWRHESLRSLAEDLAGLGLSLCLRRGPAVDVLPEVVRETGAGRVVWNRCYEPASVARDTKIETTFRAAGVETQSYAGSLLSEPGEILTGQGTPYKVFTSFWNRLRERYRAPPPHPAPEQLAPRARDRQRPSRRLGAAARGARLGWGAPGDLGSRGGRGPAAAGRLQRGRRRTIRKRPRPAGPGGQLTTLPAPALGRDRAASGVARRGPADRGRRTR